MDHSVTLFGKQLQVELSRRAEKALRAREKPVVAVVHLIFGCLLATGTQWKMTSLPLPINSG